MTTKKFNLIYDECNIIEDEVKYRMEEDETYKDQTEEEVRTAVYEDSDLFTFAWDNFKEGLTEEIFNLDKNKHRVFKVVGKQMGWRNLEGFKIVQAENGDELLNGILPDTNDFTLMCIITKTQIKIKCFHHDSPMGEWYFIKPLSKKEFKTFENE